MSMKDWIIAVLVIIGVLSVVGFVIRSCGL